MLQQKPLSHLGRIPTFRFGRLESPLATVARSAGFESWDDLVMSLRAGATTRVEAPAMSGGSIANAILLKHACEEARLHVLGIESGAGEIDYLTLIAASKEFDNLP